MYNNTNVTVHILLQFDVKLFILIYSDFTVNINSKPKHSILLIFTTEVHIYVSKFKLTHPAVVVSNARFKPHRRPPYCIVLSEIFPE